MQISKGQIFDDVARFFELGVCFAGKPNNHISADSPGRHGCTNLLNLFAIVPWAVLAMHPPQHRVAARLHRHVCVLGDARGYSDECDQFIGPIHRLDRRDAQFLERGLL